MTGSDERRRYVRINRQFVTQIFTPRSDHEIQGVTENISQGGAYIKVEDWRAFQTGDQTVTTFFLPPSFTDRGKTIGLRGEAEVKRVDQQNEGIALEFSRHFQEFEKIDHVEIAGTFRYNKISYYLQTASALEFADFIRANPHGFLLEKPPNVLDDKVVFQFNTVSLNDDHAMQPIRRDFSVASVLESRVIEVKRKKSDKATNTITIGRASTNDIVLYNSTISKDHAYLYIHPSRAVCYLVDCDSKNGTLLNGEVLKPFERYKVVDCDEICFGPQTKIVYFSSIAFANFINQIRATTSA
jgi:pSer/pThr/pTyr-binding forkhead associated (FHA) protein